VGQNIYVTQTNNNSSSGCFSGCGTTFGVLLLIGIAVKYWYVSLALVVAACAVGVWYYRTHELPDGDQAPVPVAAPVAASAAIPATRVCASCGQQAAGNFCPNCGASQTRSCSHCGKRGLESAYCPDCGSATYEPPTPT
jgi:predicted RNA-binding Zn-ribbon protein involved in translation (DUF1610 family)